MVLCFFLLLETEGVFSFFFFLLLCLEHRSVFDSPVWNRGVIFCLSVCDREVFCLPVRYREGSTGSTLLPPLTRQVAETMSRLLHPMLHHPLLCWSLLSARYCWPVNPRLHTTGCNGIRCKQCWGWHWQGRAGPALMLLRGVLGRCPAQFRVL